MNKPKRITHDWDVYIAECKTNSVIWEEAFRRINNDLQVGREQASKLAREEVSKYREQNPFPFYEDIPQDVRYAVNGRVVSDNYTRSREPVQAPVLPPLRQRFKTAPKQRVFRGRAKVYVAQDAGGLHSHSEHVAGNVHGQAD